MVGRPEYLADSAGITTRMSALCLMRITLWLLHKTSVRQFTLSSERILTPAENKDIPEGRRERDDITGLTSGLSAVFREVC